MPRSTALCCVTALVLALGVGCSSPEPDGKVPRSKDSSSGSATAASTEPATDALPTAGAPGKVPEDLRDLDWARTSVPGDFCDVAGLITFKSGRAWAQSKTYGKIHAENVPDQVTYGNVLGDSRVEAAMQVGCDNGGEMGSGRLVWAYLVFSSEQGQLKVVGTLTPQQDPPGFAVSTFEKVELSPGRVTAYENWHREDSDALCCPTGKAVTTWTPGADGSLEAGKPRITG
ncbi:hypothetical protein [Streptomyces boluensis]|uniref:Lipoprotein n=1 Tax=Streptomyces boluensis TaxID=1775135 RepID=A0A964UQ92_9ACTN|nr:hypothetical protein [Streptomyces boluensis]NBE53344.1 hypothetical protein [Streptomyces boluensis]